MAEENIKDFFQVWGSSIGSSHKAFIYESKVQAGFPSPAEDYVEGRLDLNELMVRHPSATYYVRVAGDSMEGAGIFENDFLVVDRALEARDGDIIVAFLNGEFTLKRLRIEGNKIRLEPENPKYEPIEISEGDEFMVWGVVTGVIRKFK